MGTAYLGGSEDDPNQPGAMDHCDIESMAALSGFMVVGETASTVELYRPRNKLH